MNTNVPNLDALPDEDLIAFHLKWQSVPAAEACALVGAHVREPRRVARKLAMYAQRVLAARSYRREGKIEQALAFEQKADLFYRSLPLSVRW